MASSFERSETKVLKTPSPRPKFANETRFLGEHARRLRHDTGLQKTKKLVRDQAELTWIIMQCSVVAQQQYSSGYPVPRLAIRTDLREEPA